MPVIKHAIKAKITDEETIKGEAQRDWELVFDGERYKLIPAREAEQLNMLDETQE